MNIRCGLCLGISIILLSAAMLIQPEVCAQRSESEQNGGPLPSTPTAQRPLSTAGLQPDDSSFVNFWMSKFINWWISKIDSTWTPFKKWVFKDKDNVPDLFIGKQDHFYVDPCPDDPNPHKLVEVSEDPKSKPQVNPFPRRPSRNRIDSFSPMAPRGGGRSSSSSSGSSS